MAKRHQKQLRGSVRYNVYRVTSPAHEAQIVFAGDIKGALRLVLRWQAAMGLGEVAFVIDPNWASMLSGVGRQHVDDARGWCRAPSIAVRYHADDGWGLAEPPFYPDQGLWSPN